MRMGEPGVISVSSQVFTTQTIAGKNALLSNNCSFQVKPIRFLHLLILLSTHAWFYQNNINQSELWQFRLCFKSFERSIIVVPYFGDRYNKSIFM